jgi:hypothetical protein
MNFSLFSQSDNVVFLPSRNVVFPLGYPPVKGGHHGERHYHNEHEGSKEAASCPESHREKNNAD